MATDTGEGNLSGLVVQSHEDFLRHHLGPELHQRYRQLLSAEDRKWIDEARPLQWIPIRVSDRMFDAAAKATGGSALPAARPHTGAPAHKDAQTLASQAGKLAHRGLTALRAC